MRTALVMPAMGHAVIGLLMACSTVAASAADGLRADKPLFRDPVYDGAADPVVVWNPLVKRWWMFYTNRRANVEGLGGVSWVHGTAIGIAESADKGATWTYVGTASVALPPEFGGRDATCWAPDVVRSDDGVWHMFLSVVPGVFEDWGHPRFIVHFTSRDLRTWGHAGPLPLASDRVIDASVVRMADGTWRLWYKNERDGSKIYFAESRDLNSWTDRGWSGAGQGCEGPKVFRWRGKYWMIVDRWEGLGVFRSDDATTWTAQADNILATPGTGDDDEVKGGHADVVVSGGRAFIFYFTHPGRRGSDAKKDTARQRRSSIQVAELEERNGWIVCDRDKPVLIRLEPPT